MTSQSRNRRGRWAAPMLRIGAIGAMAMLYGCIGPRPDLPASAAVEPPAAWRTGTVEATAFDHRWWTTFNEPVLADLVERAMTRNVDLELAVARVEEARAAASVALAQTAPQVTIGINGGKARTVVLGKGVTAWAGQPQVNIAYDLDLFGRLASANDAARATLLASAAGRDAVALAVASTTAIAYFALRGLDARLEIARATLVARADALRFAQRRADAGYTSRLELQQAQAEYEAARQLVPSAELAVSHAENALSVLLGDVPGSIARGKVLEDLDVPRIPAGLPSDLLRRRPDVAAAEAMLVASDSTLDAARAAMLPNVALTGSLGVALSTAFVNPVSLFSLGGTILSPLLDGGRLRAQSEVAAARRDQAAFAYRKVALTAFREVEDNLVSLDRLAEEEVAQRHQVDALREALRLASNRYREGYSPYLDQIDAQRGLLAAQLVAVQIQSDRLTTAIALYQALGGGWSQADPRRCHTC
ncbi:Outer membrane protein OprM [Cupriavidus pampae]|uniref:Outer membrane protein OprM n=2 Tax=Cupriavidus pampae TaxID=659251 RepID=A0ABM8WGS9_9BURK|nr:Outer membrane protein OprM [Cupriavidus pampae]